MKTIIAGGREVMDLNQVRMACGLAKHAGIIVTESLSGGAKGADTLGEEWAVENHIPYVRYPAYWDDVTSPGAVIRHYKHGPRKGQAFNIIAGHQRNQRMVDDAEAAIFIWDGRSTGTKDCIERAKKKGVPIYIHQV